MLGKFLSRLKRKDDRFVMRQVRDTKRYEDEKRIAASGDVTHRMKLALSPRTHQEILYYLAQNDPEPAVRQAVARNASTPIQACEIIMRDKDVDVRLSLAERLVRLLPTLSLEEHAQLYAVAVQVLGGLAVDEVLNIRMALASSLKDHAHAPPAVVSQLARDVERQVAEPILRFCAALPDDVLLDILKSTSDSWAVDAIAGRASVSADIAKAIINHKYTGGGRILLGNKGAVIDDDLLRDIVQRARNIPEWHESLALRKGLPPDIALTLAEYAHDSVREILRRRNMFDARTSTQVAESFRRRLTYALASRVAKEQTRERPYDRAVRLAKKGELTEKIITDAIGMREEEFVIAALACLARTGVPEVRRIFRLQAAKPIIALTWRAGLSMRLALQLQKDFARVPFRALIYPRDGVDYPLTPVEMEWHLDFLGIKVA